MTNFIGGWPNVNLFSLVTASAGSFTIPTPPSSSTASKIPYAPNFSAGPTGLDPYRAWSVAVIDGEFFMTNGWDSPRRWDKTLGIWAYMGSTAPTTFALALSAAGSPAAIPTGQTARYYLVGCNSTLDKESAPQGGGEVSIANATGATRDVTITWTASEFAADQDTVRIYRALNLTDDFKRVATVAVATATYLDVTPDATLRGNSAITDWDGATRTTLPPKFTGIIESQGRLIGWDKSGDFVRYSQPVRVLGTFRADDFPEDQVLQIGSDEQTGPPTALVNYQRSVIVWKRHAIYEWAGFDIATWDVRGLTTSRGTFNPNTVVAVDRNFICLDENGIYKFTPGLYAGAVGAVEEMYRTPMQPIVARLNLAASDTFCATHWPTVGQVVFWVALDYDPTPGHGIVFNYSTGRFQGIITRRQPTATGYLSDAQGALHPIIGDDMGYVWEEDYAESEGVFAGDNTATITSGAASTRLLTATGAAFSTTTVAGAPGTPMERYDSSGSVIDDGNRVYSATSTALTTYLYPSAAVSVGDSVAIGVIPAVLETGKLHFGSHEMKNVRWTYLEFDSGVSGSIRMDTSLDDAAYVRKIETSLATDVRTYVPQANTTNRNNGQCWTWRLRLSQRYANLGFHIRAIHVQYDILPSRLK